MLLTILFVACAATFQGVVVDSSSSSDPKGKCKLVGHLEECDCVTPVKTATLEKLSGLWYLVSASRDLVLDPLCVKMTLSKTERAYNVTFYKDHKPTCLALEHKEISPGIWETKSGIKGYHTYVTHCTEDMLVTVGCGIQFNNEKCQLITIFSKKPIPKPEKLTKVIKALKTDGITYRKLTMFDNKGC